MLSYYHLPSHLKRCFAYCSILPKDYEFEEKEVVLLWMAEGLIQPQQKEKEMEDLGSKYFRDLLARSFFQQSNNKKSRFVMHDLINDLAKSVAGNTCFRMEDKVEGSKQGSIFKKARHLSYLDREGDLPRGRERGFFCIGTRMKTLRLQDPKLKLDDREIVVTGGGVGE
ncbi:hypothetical protein I3760_05G197200 [Carya illinoinensis]|nr:hypothetical protein I3760_05G197200 [Carya illinoinensis]